MSDTVTKQALPTLIVERNSTSVSLVSSEKKRGKEPGTVVYAFEAPSASSDAQKEQLEKFIQFFGVEQSLFTLIAKGNIQLQKYMAEASTTEDGQDKPFDEQEFLTYVRDWSARGLTTAQLQEEIARVTTEITTLATDANFLAQGPEHMREVMTAKANRIKELQGAVAARKRKTTAEDSEA